MIPSERPASWNSPESLPYSSRYVQLVISLSRTLHHPVTLPTVTLVGTIGAMLTLLPYCTGYGDVRVNLLAFTANLWKLEQWQHCWLVPPICVFIVWRMRDRLAALPIAGHWSGLLILAGGLCAYWVGYRVDNFVIGIGAVYLSIAGGIVWLYGWRWMLALSFPWAFLFFALPLLFLESALAFRLRLIMSDASVGLLNGVGINCVQQGTAILSAPNPLLNLPRGAAFSVDVADPCSGIRSLFALTMVTALYAYFAVKPVWKQLLLFAFSIPLAVAGNMARIMMLTIGTIAFGPEVAIGTLEDPTIFHVAAGYLVFIVALAGMIGIGQLLTRDWSNSVGNLSATFRRITTARIVPTRATATGSRTLHDDEY